MTDQTSITNIVLGGVGGQGILVASDILANAALKANFDVKKSEVHGMAQRGGSVVSHVRFGRKIYSPMISAGEAQFLLAFEQLEALRYLHFLRPGGSLIINNQQIPPMTIFTSQIEYPADIEVRIKEQGYQYIQVNGLTIAEKLGNIRLLNVVMLGGPGQFLELERCNLGEKYKRAPAGSLL